MEDKRRLQSVRNRVREEREKVKNSVRFNVTNYEYNVETRYCSKTKGKEEEEGDQ